MCRHDLGTIGDGVALKGCSFRSWRRSWLRSPKLRIETARLKMRRRPRAKSNALAGLWFICQHGDGEIGQNVAKFQPATVVGLDFFASEDVCELHGRLIGQREHCVAP